jgi:hypothetical protein
MKIIKKRGLLFRLASWFVKHYGQFLLVLLIACVLTAILGIPVIHLIPDWLWEQIGRLALFAITLFALAVMLDPNRS